MLLKQEKPEMDDEEKYFGSKAKIRLKISIFKF